LASVAIAEYHPLPADPDQCWLSLLTPADADGIGGLLFTLMNFNRFWHGISLQRRDISNGAK
jgi:hypothetical protein